MQILVTEQYPKGLGSTVEELPVREQPGVKLFDKMQFSMCVPELEKEINSSIKSIILCGIEAHVCVLQTTLDLLEKGFNVFVVVDAVSSRSLTDRFFAYKQLEKAGAILTTAECIIFRLLHSAQNSKFREVQKLIMDPAPDCGLINFFS